MADKNISYWLMKSEPEAYSISQLKKEVTTLWDGIRNYQARNFMRSMKIGDQAFFYHSNCKPPGIVGMMQVTKTRVIDPTQFDVNSKYYDPKVSINSPRWDCTEMRYIGIFKKFMSLEELKDIYLPEDLQVVRKGNRLSIMPISQKTANDLMERLGKPIE
ncbi:EVE domain-containing protein [Prochlorococcus sp. MIT 1307]|uniref:EVE domain-containing protein n=1 Tax=Prochlorococcus sp. MIT 1307 TaxID=3096219 RepID=UPI002A755A70|nr:EVE domain-containing protein [Prochlorococcus sp. MIT 1307]